MRGGSCALQRKAGRCCVSAREDEHESGRREIRILVSTSCLLFVERGSLGSFGALSAGISSTPGHLPSVAQEVGDLGCPRQEEGDPVMEVLVKLGYEFLHTAGPVGMGGNCPQKEVSHVAAQRPTLAHIWVSHTLQNPLSPSSR